MLASLARTTARVPVIRQMQRPIVFSPELVQGFGSFAEFSKLVGNKDVRALEFTPTIATGIGVNALRPAYEPLLKPKIGINYSCVANVSPYLTHPSADCTIKSSTIIAGDGGSSTLTVTQALSLFRGEYPPAEIKFRALWLEIARNITQRMEGGKRGVATDSWYMTLADTDVKNLGSNSERPELHAVDCGSRD